MSVLAVAIKHLVALGMTGDALAAAIAEMEAAQDNRSVGAKRQQRYRDRQAERNEASQSVTRDDSVTPPPALDKETSPTPPKEINLTPRSGNALARKAAGFGPPEGVPADTWNEFCTQRKKPLSRTAYSRIVSTLTEGEQAGWPPGELVERSIEKTWETVFIPKEARNGQRNGRLAGGSPQRSGGSRDGFGAALREMGGHPDAYHH